MPICVKVKCPHCEKEFEILLQGNKVKKGDTGYCSTCSNHIDIFSNCAEISIDHSVLKSKMEELAEKIGKNELTNPATVLSIVAKCCNILLETKSWDAKKTICFEKQMAFSIWQKHVIVIRYGKKINKKGVKMETTKKNEFLCECGEPLDSEKLERFSLQTGCRSCSPAVACPKCRAIYSPEGSRFFHRDDKKAFLEE